MHHTAYRFMQVGAVAGLIGMCWGIGMGLMGDFTMAPAHAHLNLLGWVTMLLYGLFYRAVPEAAAGLLPKLQFWLATAGLVFMIPSLALVLMGRGAGMPTLILGSFLTLAAMGVFVTVALRLTRKSAVPAGLGSPVQ